MKFHPTAIPDVLLIEPRVHGDDRGFFMETWRHDLFTEVAGDVSFVQENHSRSGKGVLRGLHYQVENAQGKLVRVVDGEVFDVAVDIRKSSATFGKWVGETLSAQNRRQLWVPPGFAHGFLVISETADFVYKCSAYYAPDSERVIIWNDTDIGIEWPIAGSESPLQSDKDAAGVPLRDADCYG